MDAPQILPTRTRARVCVWNAELFYLAEYFCDQLPDVLPPLGDVGVESVQIPAEAERNHLEGI